MKKLGIIIALSVVGVLVVTTILLSVISKSYKMEILNSPIEMTIADTNGKHVWGGVAESYSQTQKENFEKVVSNFDSSFKQSILASMLNGNLNNKIELEYLSSEPNKTGYRVELKYPSTLLMLDGQAYKLNQSDSEKYFTSIIFFVEDGTGFEKCNFFAKVAIDESRFGYYQFTTIANTQALYDFLGELNYQ